MKKKQSTKTQTGASLLNEPARNAYFPGQKLKDVVEYVAQIRAAASAKIIRDEPKFVLKDAAAYKIIRERGLLKQTAIRATELVEQAERELAGQTERPSESIAVVERGKQLGDSEYFKTSSLFDVINYLADTEIGFKAGAELSVMEIGKYNEALELAKTYDVEENVADRIAEITRPVTVCECGHTPEKHEQYTIDDEAPGAACLECDCTSYFDANEPGQTVDPDLLNSSAGENVETENLQKYSDYPSNLIVDGVLVSLEPGFAKILTETIAQTRQTGENRVFYSHLDGWLDFADETPLGAKLIAVASPIRGNCPESKPSRGVDGQTPETLVKPEPTALDVLEHFKDKSRNSRQRLAELREKKLGGNYTNDRLEILNAQINLANEVVAHYERAGDIVEQVIAGVE